MNEELQPGEIEIKHSSGALIRITQDGNVVVTTKGDLTFEAHSDAELDEIFKDGDEGGA